MRPQEVFEPWRIKLTVTATSVFLGITEEEVRRQVESGQSSTLKLVRTTGGESVVFDVTYRFDF